VPINSACYFRRHAFAFGVAAALHALGIASTASAGELILGIIPEEEWIGSQIPAGGITPNGLRAVEAAVNELRERGRKVENYQSIYVWETEGSFLVQFSDLELHSTINDDRTPPAGGRKAIFRIDKQTFKILGAVY
jgi:hypothetical protein